MKRKGKIPKASVALPVIQCKMLFDSENELFDHDPYDTDFSVGQHKSSGLAQINAQPQDFVVVRGQTYRVSRTQISERSPDNFGGSASKEQALQQALKDAYELIGKQRRQIVEQSCRIDELEKALESTILQRREKNNDGNLIFIYLPHCSFTLCPSSQTLVHQQ